MLFVICTRGAGQFSDNCNKGRRKETFHTNCFRPVMRPKKGLKQAKRMISTAKLNTLLRLHLQPIDVVVFHDPSGKINLGSSLALRCFQRLSIPHLAAQPCP